MRDNVILCVHGQGVAHVHNARAVVWPVPHNPKFDLDSIEHIARDENGRPTDATASHWAVLVADVEERKFWWVDSNDNGADTFHSAAQGTKHLASVYGGRRA